MNWIKKQTEIVVDDVKGGWKFYLTFLIVSIIYSLIFKLEPEIATIVVAISLFVTLGVLAIFAVITVRKEDKDNK